MSCIQKYTKYHSANYSRYIKSNTHQIIKNVREH